MTTKVSSKGQVVLPGPIRRRLGIRTGDSLEARIEAGRIVLTPQTRKTYKAKIVRDPISGLPVLTAGSGSPILSSKEVHEIQADFP
ncbi:MAG TPA: AbrB/MazE/SpoVT family DNA-binding domain-containing protein [Candidatus Angelobacter sp.]|nr:AbrB/MazE/SpoVT family DNA-binding domain-containing protein [Candidatus Angelobacter sp.]